MVMVENFVDYKYIGLPFKANKTSVVSEIGIMNYSTSNYV